MLPEPFEIVELPRLLAENVHDDIAEIEQFPFGAGFAFAMGKADAVAIEAFLDGVANRAQLRLALPRANQEIVSERACAGEFQHRDIDCLLVLSRFNGPANFRIKRFHSHR